MTEPMAPWQLEEIRHHVRLNEHQSHRPWQSIVAIKDLLREVERLTAELTHETTTCQDWWHRAEAASDDVERLTAERDVAIQRAEALAIQLEACQAALAETIHDAGENSRERDAAIQRAEAAERLLQDSQPLRRHEQSELPTRSLTSLGWFPTVADITGLDPHS